MPQHRVTALGEHTSLHDRKVRAGQRLLLAFEGTNLPKDLRSLLRIFTPAGFLLEPGNMEEPAQVLDLCRELTALLPSRTPALLAADPFRLPAPITAWPPPAWLGNADDPDLTRRLAVAVNTEAAALGLNLLFGPTLDVPSVSDAWSGQSSFSRDPHRVARHAAAWLEGACGEGAPLTCVRHFPGLGGLSTTEAARSHPTVERDVPALRHEDLPPFHASSSFPVAVQVPHVWFPAWDDERPASASTPILGLLRDEWGFEGLVIGGDLGASFLRESASDLERHLEDALSSGVDLHPCPDDPAFDVAVFEHLVRLQESTDALDLSAADSYGRLRSARDRHLPVRLSDSQEVGSLDHRLLVEWIRARGA